MEKLSKEYRLIKALRKRMPYHDGSMRMGKEKSKNFKDALREMDRFEKELKRNLE